MVGSEDFGVAVGGDLHLQPHKVIPVWMERTNEAGSETWIRHGVVLIQPD